MEIVCKRCALLKDESEIYENDICFNCNEEINNIRKITEKPLIPKKEVLPDRIQEWFSKKDGNANFATSREIFKASDEDIDLKTELNFQEIALINNMLYNDKVLIAKKLKPLYRSYLIQYMRLKLSHERKSRGEFVNINQADKGNSLNFSGLNQATSVKDAKK